ncbi:TPA: cysteine synthase A [Enterococcus faecium]|uniref:cysteine synthase A n=1 Tax=Enterococcus faecium TaxID=1352 RepID=UPI000A64FD58|nr:cysteine synthase A [Enterococcus faecium]HAQ1386068.1 cysteine synthase A [Enterococcus faecium Ef_aus0057]HAQ1407130.1 cysteine synthase A [Enterococcus faecium Ef_aus0050]HAQ1410117.1 cysteine synthase A [Enterococcus faecium Ef_aus0030]HAQ1415776.1 cysteine synthase A [Enterococcus faecium Ef_aus0018]MCH0100926.1 cysteine synthase A [Enterococcus faecium]
MTAIYNSVTELIGKTPIVKLNKIVPEDSADVFVKLEFFNPGGSVKDRIALSMIEKAEHDGLLKPGDTIIEPTSGNTGIGLSMVGVAKGYKVIIVMPETMSIERRLLMKGYGAELILTPGADGISGSIREAERLAKENGYFLPLQFENEANPLVHEKTTGPEIHQAFGVNGLDAFVAGIGTGGTITGAGRELKRVYPKIELIGVEPAESAILEGKEAGPHKIQGIGTGFVPKTLDTSVYDTVLSISGDEAMETAREVGRKEGILVGISSGAAIAAALKVAKELGKGKKVLAVVPDNGERYLSTALYQEI